MTLIRDITGVVLAGGRSSRFGSNKALAPIGSENMIERIARVMKHVFTETNLVTNTPEEYRFLDLPILQDVEPYEGPLGGIRSVFEKTEALGVFVTACDVPLIEERSVRNIIGRAGRSEAAIPVHEGRHEYLTALYRRELLPDMVSYMKAGGRSLDGFLRDRAGVAWIPVDGDFCVNINTRKELESLRAR